LDDESARFLAGADAIGLAEQKIVKLREDIESHRDLSHHLVSRRTTTACLVGWDRHERTWAGTRDGLI